MNMTLPTTPSVVAPTSSRKFGISRRLATIISTISALTLLAAACGSSHDTAAGSSGDPVVEIAAPANGAQVGQSFEVQLKLNFPIGDPSTGREHVHLYYDGNTTEGEYGIAYNDTFTVTGLSPGKHTIQAVVAHADHSLTDSRSQEITVEVTNATGTTTAAPPTSAGNSGY
jgi:hypothetical protein